MLHLSEILMRHHELNSFEELVELVRKYAESGERFLSIDVRPPYPDTPENWDIVLEAAFT
jgi:hypothetical protein